MKSLALGLSTALLGGLAACGGGSMGSINNPLPPPPAINANVAVQNTTNGAFNLAMSTSFQPAEWDFQFFEQFPGATTPFSQSTAPAHPFAGNFARCAARSRRHELNQLDLHDSRCDHPAGSGSSRPYS